MKRALTFAFFIVFTGLLVAGCPPRTEPPGNPPSVPVPGQPGGAP